jgi:diketogulonate reductase-like aldo/keto reductase
MDFNGIPVIQLSNGVTMPRLGAGTAFHTHKPFGQWSGTFDNGYGLFNGFLPEQAWQGCSNAFHAGLRHFDNAYFYGSGRHLGDVLKPHFMDGSLMREELFLTTKLAHPPVPPEMAMSPLTCYDPRLVDDIDLRTKTDYQKALDEMGIGYFDLILIHWPAGFNESDGDFARQHRAQVYTAFEDLLRLGKVRAIGVSNFSQRHLEQLREDCTIMPMVNQIEVHPLCQQRDLVAYSQSLGVVVQAYAPFASGSPGILDNPVLVEIAASVERSVGQVILRWLIQRNIVPLPRSSSVHRYRENMAVFDFELSTEQMECIWQLQADEVPNARTTPSLDDIP